MSVSTSTVMSCMRRWPDRRLGRLACIVALLFGVVASSTSDALAAHEIQVFPRRWQAPRLARASGAPGKKLLGVVPHRTRKSSQSGPFAPPLGGQPGYEYPPVTGTEINDSSRVMPTTTVRTVYRF